MFKVGNFTTKKEPLVLQIKQTKKEEELLRCFSEIKNFDISERYKNLSSFFFNVNENISSYYIVNKLFYDYLSTLPDTFPPITMYKSSNSSLLTDDENNVFLLPHNNDVNSNDILYIKKNIFNSIEIEATNGKKIPILVFLSSIIKDIRSLPEHFARQLVSEFGKQKNKLLLTNAVMSKILTVMNILKLNDNKEVQMQFRKIQYMNLKEKSYFFIDGINSKRAEIVDVDNYDYLDLKDDAFVIKNNNNNKTKSFPLEAIVNFLFEKSELSLNKELINLFINLLLIPSLKVEVIPSENIGSFYKKEINIDSCTSGSSALQIFQNEKRLKLLYLKNNDEVIGRALFWNTNKFILLESVYVNKKYTNRKNAIEEIIYSYIKQLQTLSNFKELLEKKNIYVKKQTKLIDVTHYNGLYNQINLNNFNKEEDILLDIKNVDINFDLVQGQKLYMDTFLYYDLSSKTLSNYNNSNNETTIVLLRFK